MNEEPKDITPKQAAGVAAREALGKAEEAYRVATRSAYPIGTTIRFLRGHHWLEGVVRGYGWQGGSLRVLNPKSQKTLKVYGFPWSADDTPDILEEFPRCQECAEPGTQLAECPAYPEGACFCPDHMPPQPEPEHLDP